MIFLRLKQMNVIVVLNMLIILMILDFIPVKLVVLVFAKSLRYRDER